MRELAVESEQSQLAVALAVAEACIRAAGRERRSVEVVEESPGQVTGMTKDEWQTGMWGATTSWGAKGNKCTGEWK